MFMPLGALLAGRRPTWAIAALGLGVAAVIEFVQVSVPGRYSTLSDLVSNGLGAVLGCGVALMGRRAMRTGGQAYAVVLAGAPGLFVVIAGIALQPSYLDGPHFAEWTPEDAAYERYTGAVLSATLNGTNLRPGPVPARLEPRIAMRGDWWLKTRMVKGIPTNESVALVRMYASTGVFFLGVDGEDVVWRRRVRARPMRLAYSDAYLRDGLAPFRTGDTVTVAVGEEGGSLCMAVESREVCGVGMAPAHTWTLLRTSATDSRLRLGVLDLVWGGVLFFPAAVLGTGTMSTLLLTAVDGGLMMMAVLLTPLTGPGWVDLAGVALGLFLGCKARSLVRALIE
jgi:hypothetical protein